MKKINVTRIVLKDMFNYKTEYNRLFVYNPDQYTVIGYYKNLPIAKVIDNKHCHLSGKFLAMAKKQAFNGYLVVFDDLAEDCPKYVQKFLEYHEIGHIMSGHLDKLGKQGIKNYMNRLLGKGKEAKMEYEADSYSAKMIGNYWAIASLMYLKRHFKLGFFCGLELRRRINYIRKNAVE